MIWNTTSRAFSCFLICKLIWSESISLLSIGPCVALSNPEYFCILPSLALANNRVFFNESLKDFDNLLHLSLRSNSLFICSRAVSIVSNEKIDKMEITFFPNRGLNPVRWTKSYTLLHRSKSRLVPQGSTSVSYTLQRRYNTVAYNAETVIMWLGRGSHFFPPPV